MIVFFGDKDSRQNKTSYLIINLKAFEAKMPLLVLKFGGILALKMFSFQV